MKSCRFLIFLIFFNSFTFALSAEWVIHGGAQFSYNSNLNHAVAENDMKADYSLNPFLYLGDYFQLSDSAQIFFGVDLNGNIYKEYYRLNISLAQLCLGIKMKMGLGAFAPWFSLKGSAGAIIAMEKEREGIFSGSGIILGKRLQDRLEISGGYEYQWSSTQNVLFEKRDHIFHLEANFSLSENISLSLTYKFTLGNYLIYYTKVKDYYSYYYPQEEPEFDTFGIKMQINKEKALQHGIFLDVLFALSNKLSINLGVVGYKAITKEYSYLDYAAKIGFFYYF